jgi:hypothetical protein
MKITLSTSQAIHYLDSDHFSYSGAKALIEYLEELEECEGVEMELDAVALACQYNEYESFTEAYQDRYQGEEITEAEAQEYFESETIVIPFDGGVIIDSEF